MSETRPGISRRTLVKGTAWAVPAVAVASAAPAMAKSGAKPSVQVLNACKQPGASCEKDYGFLKGYTFLVRVSNSTAQDVYIYTSSTPPPAPNQALVPYFQVTSTVPFTYSSARLFTPPSTIGAQLAASQLIPANSSILIIINAGTNSNSANTDAVGSLWFPWGHTETIGGDHDHSYTPSPAVSLPPGEGWTGGSFNFASTPPCDNCYPGAGSTTTTSTTQAPALQQAQVDAPTSGASSQPGDQTPPPADPSSTLGAPDAALNEVASSPPPEVVG